MTPSTTQYYIIASIVLPVWFGGRRVKALSLKVSTAKSACLMQWSQNKVVSGQELFLDNVKKTQDRFAGKKLNKHTIFLLF